MAQVLNGGGSSAAAADQAAPISTPDDSSSARLAFIGNVLIGYKVEAQVR
jgi:putative salt-induced outer membrane protein YdiY